MTTVYIDQDASTLGEDATQSDLDRYATNLATHLDARFPGRDISVEQCLGGGRTPCPEDEQIDEYVRELQAGDGWAELVDSAVRCDDCGAPADKDGVPQCEGDHT